jgi:hypothetical protein
MPADPIARLRETGEKLTPKLREELLSLGRSAVEPLIELLEDDLGDWPSIHAVDLLADLKATEAIEPMLDALPELTFDDILYSRIVTRLPDLGPAVVEPALAVLSDEQEQGEDTDEETVSGICEVLAKLGVKDERVFEALCWAFKRGEPWTASAFAIYGDKRAVPILEAAIATFEPDFGRAWGGVELMDLVEPYENLGGVLPPDVRARVDGWFARWEAMRRRSREVTPAAVSRKVGRNDPCDCGSGKKYKKCCLDTDEAARPRTLEANGDRPHASGGVSDDELDLAKQYFREKDAGRGPAAQMADYAKPIIDSTDGSFEAMQQALNIAMLFWNLSVLRDAGKREEALSEMVARIGEADRAEFEETARMMIERHRTMFPEMHAGDSRSVISRV